MAPAASPSKPPASVSRVVSTIASLTTCSRLAPNACRTAISFTRLLARIKSRFVRLTAPISNRANAPACIHNKAGRMFATWSA